MDPATFATQLEILAVRGFGEMGKCAPKLDGQGPVHCSPTELWVTKTYRQCSSGYSYPGHSGSLPCVGESSGAGDGVSPGCWPGPGPAENVQWLPGAWIFQTECTQASWVPVANVSQSDVVAHRKGGGGGGCSQVAPLEIMSSLIAQLLRAAQEDHPAEVKVPPDAGARPPSVVPGVGISGQSQLSEVELVMVCFLRWSKGDYIHDTPMACRVGGILCCVCR